VVRDITKGGYIRSGAIAAQLDLRDAVLPQAQAQLDELAAGLAQALSDKPAPSDAVSVGARNGFDLDLTGLAAGNRVTVSVTDPGGAKRLLTFAATESAEAGERAKAAGLIPLDITGGSSSIASQIGAALGAEYQVSNPSGGTVRILGDGSTSTVVGAAGALTVSGIATGDPEIPLFTDGGTARGIYTGSFEGSAQLAGFASRISVNAAVLASPGVLASYGAGVPAGDTTRTTLMADRLLSSTRAFSGSAGIGGSTSPWTGTVSDFAQAVVATQATEANSASDLDAGQQVVLNAVQSRYAEQAGVSIDTELAQLIQLQTAYGANARLMTAAREMVDTLFRIAG
jgi:flagellar hook-associated protein 1 FlgK